MKPVIGLYGIQDRQNGQYPLETHDHAICRLEAGRVERHLALERWTRRKHDNRMHEQIENVAALGFFSPGEDAVLACADSFVGRAFVSREGSWRIEAPLSDSLSVAPVAARAHIQGRRLEAWIVPHELAHIGSSLPFLGEWPDNTLLVHVDGGASVSNCSAWLWRGGQLSLLHHSWELFSAVSGYATNNLAQALVGETWQTFLSVPGKLMGLAAWAEPNPDLTAWLTQNDWFARLRGGPEPFIVAARRDMGWTGQLHPDDALVRGIAACFQKRFEDAVAEYVHRFAQATKTRHLIMAGGAALNLPSNQRISNLGCFDSIFIPPCAGDDGLALGAASIVHFMNAGSMQIHSPFLNSVGAPELPRASSAEIGAIADAIASGRVVGTCFGAGEVGPRALGHRSLLALPTRESARRVSVDMKLREHWRPVAPLVLGELADELFDGSPSRSSLARNMLGRFVARRLAFETAPGVVHADGSARVQVVDNEPELQPIRQLLQALWERHRIPCVLNTSFNRRGEPLVQTLDHARDAAHELRVDFLWHSGGCEEITDVA